MAERIKMRGKEYAALQTLFALNSAYQVTIGDLEARAKMVPGTWRDMKLIANKVESVQNAILQTVPVEKLMAIRQELNMVHVYTRVEAPGIRTIPKQNLSVVPTPALNELLNYLVNAECLTCDKTAVESRKCPWRQIIEAALPHEVGGEEGEHCKYSDMVLGLDMEVG